MRTYLEITPRIKVLNERCRVFLDLAEILSDSIADTKMSTLTWIIIILICISIAITTTEVFMRFVLLSKGGHGVHGSADDGGNGTGEAPVPSGEAMLGWLAENGRCVCEGAIERANEIFAMQQAEL